MSPSAEKSTLAAVDWPRWLEIAREQARTEPAKDLVSQLLDPENWAQNLEEARELQSETRQITSVLSRDGLWGPLTELPDPEPAFDALARGAVLELESLAEVRAWLYAMQAWAEFPREELSQGSFKESLEQIVNPTDSLRILNRVLTPQGELSENASPKLTELFSETRSLKKQIHAVLDHLLKTFSQKGVLQENFSDLRDGRYVIPVKVSSQGEVDGIIYEASASRQTVFVEPKEVSPLNNRLRRLYNDLAEEKFRVLRETCKSLTPHISTFRTNSEIITHWDLAQARARTGERYQGKTIDVIEERKFSIRETAHPLLWWSMSEEEIVRNDIHVDSPIQTLLLTGPNTGGKTVLLKTLGLSAIFARTGFTLPALHSPEIPYFDSIFADLGDAQSIEAHLSSFAGHIMRFKQILEQVTVQSLVLLDELNSATDPEEGAALGRAVLETVMNQGAIVVSTTHDPHLKALSLSDQRILTASMAFNEQSRTPSYLLVPGVPGRSRALETAERLGIPDRVLKLARSYLTDQHNVFENLVARLEADSRAAAIARQEAVKLKSDAEKYRDQWQEKLQSNIGEITTKTRQRMRQAFERAQEEIRQALVKIEETKSRKDIGEVRRRLGESFSEASTEVDTVLKEEAPEAAELLSRGTTTNISEQADFPIEPGSLVYIPKWKKSGEVIAISGDKLKVAMGSLQLNLERSQVSAANPQGKSRPKKVANVNVKISEDPDSSGLGSRIDLRGIRFEEAMSVLESYLDQAYRSGAYSEVTVVHGLGTGALREGTRSLLSRTPYVKEFRDGGTARGGTGATVVEFER